MSFKFFYLKKKKDIIVKIETNNLDDKKMYLFAMRYVAYTV